MAEVETLSPWWRRSAIVTIVLCFCVLGWLAKLTYSGAPPIPERVVDTDGAVLFTNAEITAGQQVFLRYGLMENGTIWGHGAYLGPDFSAEYLHTLALDAERTVAERHGFVMNAALEAPKQLIVKAEVVRLLKQNRYDPVCGELLNFPQNQQLHVFIQLVCVEFQFRRQLESEISRCNVAARNMTQVLRLAVEAHHSVRRA